MNDFNIIKINKKKDILQVYYRKQNLKETYLTVFILDLLIKKKYKNAFIPLEQQVRYSSVYDFISLNNPEFFL